jgi:hypothetical protein
MNASSKLRKVVESLPGSSPQIQQKTGIGGSTVRKHLQDMRESKKIYIVDWDRNTVGKFIAIYALGALPDKPCTFTKITGKQKRKREWRRIKKDRSNEHKNAMARAKRSADKIIKSGVKATWLSPLLQMSA